MKRSGKEKGVFLMVKNIRTIGSIVSPTRPQHEDGAGVEYVNLLSEQRSPFETDGDKIAFSEGFRALADKTQVHDRTGSEGGYRNRLTHSMEVSRVGRSLGTAVGGRMIAYYGLHAAPSGEAFWRVDPTEIGHIVAASAMAHDLGNPPLGHEGEDEISRFYADTPLGQKICSMVEAPLASELCLHEGNAQGFRMITRTMGWREGGGLNLTSATLAAFGKYPFPLRPGEKKYGVHHADLETMETVAQATGMRPDPKGGWKRHPLAYLMEAADDICYLTVDLEDATLLGLVSYEQLLDKFSLVLDKASIDEARSMASRSHSIKYLRSKMVKSLINACVEVYPSIAEQIEEGDLCKSTHGGGFIGHSRHGEAMAQIREFSEKEIYRAPALADVRSSYRQVVTNALTGLNADLLNWIDNHADEMLTQSSEKAGMLAYLPAARIGSMVPKDPGAAVRWLLDEVTLMTDGQILDLSGRLTAHHHEVSA
jgi:dGTPase